MNPTIHDSRADQAFDTALRALHQHSLQAISPGVRWKLRPGAVRQPRATRGWFADWRLGSFAAGAAAAIFALAFGMALWSQPDPGAQPDALIVADAAQTQGTSVLEQDPEFFAWLASDDANLMAME